MKGLFILSLVIFLSCCSCNKEDEDFTPYPGGKKEQTYPRS